MIKRYILLLILISSIGFANAIVTSILTVHGNKATVKVSNINIGISGFIVKDLKGGHSYIINSAVVVGYNKTSHIAILKLGKFHELKQLYLPTLKLRASAGDKAVLAFGYDRALLIAPNKQTYFKITHALPSLEWVHPDIFAMLLSENGHPRPLKSDFTQMCHISSVGLLYIYLKQKLITIDCLSMKVLQISPAPLKSRPAQLPFYNRVGKIQSNWFGAGSHRLRVYAPYYLKLLQKYNKNNEELKGIR